MIFIYSFNLYIDIILKQLNKLKNIEKYKYIFQYIFYYDIIYCIVI